MRTTNKGQKERKKERKSALLCELNDCVTVGVCLEETCVRSPGKEEREEGRRKEEREEGRRGERRREEWRDRPAPLAS